MNKPPSQNSKLKYVLPSAVILVLLVTMYTVCYSIMSFQLSAYTSNKSQVVNEWVAEGMDRSSVDKTINRLTSRFSVLKASVMEEILYAELYMVIIMLIENIVFRDKYRLVDILEYLVLSCFEYPSVRNCAQLFAALGVLPILFAVSALSLFIYFTFRKITHKEQILYGVCILEILVTILFYNYYDPLKQSNRGTFIINNPKPYGPQLRKIALLADNTDIKPQLRDQIFELSAKYGVGPDSVFVDERSQINAFAPSSPLFKFVVFTSGAARSLSNRQLMGCLSHELGHIANNDSFTVFCLVLTSTIMNLGYTLSVYKTVSRYCNGLAALATVAYFGQFFNLALIRMFVYKFQYDYELKADNESFKNGYAKDCLEYFKILSAANEGVFFDYTSYFAGLDVRHPSALQRIKALRKHLATN